LKPGKKTGKSLSSLGQLLILFSYFSNKKISKGKEMSIYRALSLYEVKRFYGSGKLIHS